MFIDELNEHVKMFERMLGLKIDVDQAAALITDALRLGNKLFLAGNGGSASDAQHLAAEFVGRFNYDREPLPAIALSTDTSVLTCIANDYDFTEIFSRQLRALAVPGDIAILISTSGNSQNLIEAANWCKKLDVYTIGLVGETGGKLNSIVDMSLRVPSKSTARIQEGHIFLGHCMCGIVEENLRPRTESNNS